MKFLKSTMAILFLIVVTNQGIINAASPGLGGIAPAGSGATRSEGWLAAVSRYGQGAVDAVYAGARNLLGDDERLAVARKTSLEFSTLRGTEDNAIAIFALTFPVFNTTSLLDIYFVLYFLARYQESQPALLKMLNSYQSIRIENNKINLVASGSHTGKGRQLLSNMIGKRAKEALEGAWFDTFDNKRIALLAKHFYANNSMKNFTLEDIAAFAADVKALEGSLTSLFTKVKDTLKTGVAVAGVVGAGVTYNAGSIWPLVGAGTVAAQAAWSGTKVAYSFVTTAMPFAVSLVKDNPKTALGLVLASGAYNYLSSPDDQSAKK